MAASLTAVAFQGQRSDLTGFILSVGFVYRTIENYTKHHLKFGKNQADDLVAVFNRFI